MHLWDIFRPWCSNGVKLGPEQPIPPYFIENKLIPWMFLVLTNKNTYFVFSVCNCKVDNKPQNSEKPVFLKPSVFFYWSYEIC